MSTAKINVRTVPSLSFKDQSSTYSGQVFDDPRTYATQPYGFGIMKTKDNFIHTGYFKAGKAVGQGRFQAPNGDLFYGYWNSGNKRDGKGLTIRGSDQTELVETYNDGKLLKKLKRAAPKSTSLYWLTNSDLISISSDGMNSSSNVNSTVLGRSGHTCTANAEESMLVLIGGENIIHEEDNIALFDLGNKSWLKAQFSGEVKIPILSGHSATLWKNKIVVIGGQMSGLEVNSSVYVLDLTTGSITSPIQKQLSFHNHTATLLPNTNTIVVIVQSSVFTLDLLHWTWSEQSTDIRQLKKAPRSYISHSAVSVKDMIYVFGGKILGGMQQDNQQGKKYERCTSELRILHTKNWQWECPGTILSTSGSTSISANSSSDYSGFVQSTADVPRCEHSATAIDNRYMLILGGFTTSNPQMSLVDENYLNDVQILDCETLQWLPQPSQLVWPLPASEHSCVWLKGMREVWSFGGRNHGALEGLNEWNRLKVPVKVDQIGSTPATTEAKSSESASLKSSCIIASNASSSVNKPVKPITPMSPSATITGDAAGSGSILDAFKAGYK